jgi:hypothetical protein
MRKTITSVAAATLLLLSMSASADVAQAWQCELAEGKTNDDLMTLSRSWVAAAKEIDDSASARLYFPVAGDAEEGSFIIVFYLPDFTSWGQFMDAYADSPVANIDAGWNETAPCEKVSALWDTVDLE